MTVWVVPIEPLEMRYSAQWRRWFAEEWPQARFIDGTTLTDRIEVGSFLDVYGTNYYKASQVMAIADLLRNNEIQNGDTLFFLDLWFPLEQVFYMLDGGDTAVAVSGILHAGSYDPHDFLARKGMAPWAQYMEQGWLARVNQIFVFSEFHRDMVCAAYSGVPGLRTRIEVAPFPYKVAELDKYRSSTKDYQVVFPHRMDPEKSPEIVSFLRRRGISVITTAGRSKEDYYRILGRSEFAVSWAEQETYGIAMMEASYLGAMPVVPNRLSYRDLYPDFCREDSLEEVAKAIQRGGVSRNAEGAAPGPWLDCQWAFSYLWSRLTSEVVC